jgi:ribonuclease R
MSELEQQILAHVTHANYRPVKPRVIAKQLGMDADGARDVKRAIKQLVRQRKLAYATSHLVRPATVADQSRLVGKFRRFAAGHGFVILPSGGPGKEKPPDIYIPAKCTHDAATGDTVLVRLRKGGSARRFGRTGQPGGDQKQEGEIVEVLERDTHRFVGVYFESGGMGMVQIDGTVFAQPISVGDPGAKNAQPDDKVVIEMVRFPSHMHDGEGVIVEVLGQRGAPGIDTLSIIHEFDLPGDFAPDALEEARRRAVEFDASIDDRHDFTTDTVITIDPVDARDFDDAISLVRLENGHWRLGVHIADVSHFVRPKTALDREARDRATSVYLPDRVIPMLPEIISNNLASLQPDRVRYTKSAVIEYTADGVRVGADFYSGAIRSAHRFAYEEVDDYLVSPPRWRSKLSPEVHALVGRMHTLAMILRKRRLKRGALELSLSEIKIDLDRGGEVAGAHVVENTESHQIIEEFMLAANEAVAEHLQAAELAFLRRVHMPPDPRKLKALTEFVTELGFDVESLESRFELQKLLGHVKGRPEEHAVNYAVLRSFQQAVYSPVVEGHYALASDCYCHFTSPIRRYPDLTVHRLLEGLFSKKKPRSDADELVALGEHCSERERRAEAAERELIKVKLLNYMSQRIGEEMDAVITGVQNFGLFAQGLKLPAEGFVHVTALSDDYYRYDAATHSLTGNRQGNTFRLGDRIRVAVARVDVDRRELDFRVVAREGREGRPVEKGKPKRQAKMTHSDCGKAKKKRRKS